MKGWKIKAGLLFAGLFAIDLVLEAVTVHQWQPLEISFMAQNAVMTSVKLHTVCVTLLITIGNIHLVSITSINHKFNHGNFRMPTSLQDALLPHPSLHNLLAAPFTQIGVVHT